jgi:hypothetical protein
MENYCKAALPGNSGGAAFFRRPILLAGSDGWRIVTGRQKTEDKIRNEMPMPAFLILNSEF